MMLRAIEIRHGQEARSRRAFCRYRADDLGQSIRGVPVLGTFADLDQVVQDFHERGVADPPPRGDPERAGAGSQSRTC